MSALGLLYALLAALSYWAWARCPVAPYLAPVLVLLSGYSDVLDGLIARLYGLSSRAGAMLDSVLDRYADVAILIGIWSGGLCDPFWALLAISGSLLVSYTRARAEGLGVSLGGVGLAERAERLIIIIVASLLTLRWPRALDLAVVTLAFLTHLTAAQRVACALLALRTSGPSSSS